MPSKEVTAALLNTTAEEILNNAKFAETAVIECIMASDIIQSYLERQCNKVQLGQCSSFVAYNMAFYLGFVMAQQIFAPETFESLPLKN